MMNKLLSILMMMMFFSGLAAADSGCEEAYEMGFLDGFLLGEEVDEYQPTPQPLDCYTWTQNPVGGTICPDGFTLKSEMTCSGHTIKKCFRCQSTSRCTTSCGLSYRRGRCGIDNPPDRYYESYKCKCSDPA